jgi:hypothetical protein
MTPNGIEDAAADFGDAVGANVGENDGGFTTTAAETDTTAAETVVNTDEPYTTAASCTYDVKLPSSTAVCKFEVRDVYKVLASSEKSTRFSDTTTVTLILYVTAWI